MALGMLAILGAATSSARQAVTTPPMGWNSWDCFQGDLNETGAMAVAESMSRLLKPSGYDILTIDEFWYADDCSATSKCIDANGRPQPDVEKWPSSSDGRGFRAFADKMHAMGLRLGIHTLRGSVSAAALAAKSPILGTKYTVNDIATTQCSWNKNWFAVNMSHPAAQPWLDSVYGQYAEWGVDLIKNDCIFANNYVEDNIKGVSAAIAKTNRPTVYSLSPGGGDPETEFGQAKAIAGDVNMYRVTGDWHGGDLTYHFQIAETMQSLIGIDGLAGKSFPDLDMLNPYQNASTDPEFRAQMTLWSIARSPLIYGADIRSPALSPADVALLTNHEMLAINQKSTNNKFLRSVSTDNFVVWSADGTAPGTHHVGIVSTAKEATTAKVPFAALGISKTTCSVTDVWSGTTKQASSVSTPIPKGRPYFGALFTVSDCS